MQDLKTKILNAVAANQAQILEFTKTLVAIPTENPPGAYYKPCVEAIGRELSEIGLNYEMIEVPTPADAQGQTYPRYCILGSYGSGRRTLYFHGHYDVVPAASPDQFDPRLQGNRLLGRGSSDMKSGLAAMIYAIKAVKSAGVDLDGKIGLAIVPDEETGGLLGSRYLADTGLLGQNGIGMLLPEPTSGVIWNAHRGAISLRITVQGKPAHVGLQYAGINAFETMLPVANALLELKREVECRTTAYNVQPDAARRSILMMGGHTKGGTSFNLVPGEFSFTVDRRINPEENLDVEKRRLLTLLEAVREDGIDLEIEILQEGGTSATAEDDPLAQVLGRNIEIVTGKPAKFEMCPGILETRFYSELGIPALSYGPGLLSVSHGPDEFVNVEDIYNCTAIYALSALEMLSA